MVGGGGNRTPGASDVSRDSADTHESRPRGCCTPGCTERAGTGETDADLRAVVDAWPTLSAAVRAGILAMVRASLEGAR